VKKFVSLCKLVDEDGEERQVTHSPFKFGLHHLCDWREITSKARKGHY